MAPILSSDKFLPKLGAAIVAELLGTFLFSLFGAAAPGKVAAAANGLALAVFVYATANISGGHLNPAVTVATVITGHTSAFRGVLYILALAGLLAWPLYGSGAELGKLKDSAWPKGKADGYSELPQTSE